MEEINMGLYAYEPSGTKVKLHFNDGSILEPYGFALGEQMWMDDGSLYLRLQTTSGFIPTLLDKMLELGSNDVTVELTSNHFGIARILAQLDGAEGEVKMLQVGLRSTVEIPDTLIQIILKLGE